MENEVKISVLIPVYNAEKYLSKCLDSILNQTFKEFEVICVNDGSIDDSLEILKFYKNKDRRIKLVDQINKGVSGARNTALKHVKGKYIIWIDPDDWVEQNYFKESYEIIEKSQVDILVLDYYREEKLKNKVTYHQNNMEEIDRIEYINNIFIGKVNYYIWNKIIKTSLYIKNNIRYPEDIFWGEDRVVLPKLLYCSSKIKKIDKAYYHYVCNSESISQKKYDLDFILSKVSKQYLNQIYELENFFFLDNRIKINNLKVVNCIWYFTKYDAWNNPKFLMYQENDEIIKVFLDGIKNVKVKELKLSLKMKILIYILKFLNYKQVLIYFCFLYFYFLKSLNAWRNKER